MELVNKVAIIGAGRNLGEDTAKLFAGEGAAVRRGNGRECIR
jgi:NAD(P)-dependent dehydrogenase (short-subunit alcohol dehydrogenase family)